MSDEDMSEGKSLTSTEANLPSKRLQGEGCRLPFTSFAEGEREMSPDSEVFERGEGDISPN